VVFWADVPCNVVVDTTILAKRFNPEDGSSTVSETLVSSHHTTRRTIPENHVSYLHRRENLRSVTAVVHMRSKSSFLAYFKLLKCWIFKTRRCRIGQFMLCGCQPAFILPTSYIATNFVVSMNVIIEVITI
jgi:hypothetical protein